MADEHRGIAFSIPLGAGVGLVVGVAVTGGPGIGVGITLGAGIGVIVGVLCDGWQARSTSRGP